MTADPHPERTRLWLSRTGLPPPELRGFVPRTEDEPVPDVPAAKLRGPPRARRRTRKRKKLSA